MLRQGPILTSLDVQTGIPTGSLGPGLFKITAILYLKCTTCCHLCFLFVCFVSFKTRKVLGTMTAGFVLGFQKGFVFGGGKRQRQNCLLLTLNLALPTSKQSFRFIT